MDSVYRHLEKTRQVQAVLRAFEARDRYLLEDNLWRVSFWSCLNLMVILGVAVAQTYTLRRLFDNTKRVCTWQNQHITFIPHGIIRQRELFYFLFCKFCIDIPLHHVDLQILDLEMRVIWEIKIESETHILGRFVMHFEKIKSVNLITVAHRLWPMTQA